MMQAYKPKAVPPRIPQGMFVLPELPSLGMTLKLEPFVVDSKINLEKVVASIEKTFSRHLPKVITECNRFRDEIYPQDDDEDRYMREKCVRIPFINIRWRRSSEAINVVTTIPSNLTLNDMSLAGSMRCSGRGAEGEKFHYTSTTDGNSAAVATIARCQKRRQDRSTSVASKSSYDGQLFHYIDPTPGDIGAVDYLKYVGRYFEDERTFKIFSICEMRNIGARRSTNI